MTDNEIDDVRALTDACNVISSAVDGIKKAFGAPGDYGYSSPSGEALFRLYRENLMLLDAADRCRVTLAAAKGAA